MQIKLTLVNIGDDKMTNSVIIEKKQLFSAIKYKLIFNIALSLFIIALDLLILFLFINGKLDFTVRSMIITAIVMGGGALIIHNCCLLIFDYLNSTANVLECKAIHMRLNTKRTLYNIDYTDLNGQNNNIVLETVKISKNVGNFQRATPVNVFYTERSKLLLGFEENGKTTWFI